MTRPRRNCHNHMLYGQRDSSCSSTAGDLQTSMSPGASLPAPPQWLQSKCPTGEGSAATGSEATGDGGEPSGGVVGGGRPCAREAEQKGRSQGKRWILPRT